MSEIVVVDKLDLRDLPDFGRLSTTMFKSLDGTIYTTKSNIMSDGRTIGEHILEWFGGMRVIRHPATTEELSKMQSRPPLLCRPCLADGMVYADIKAAYPSIYKNLSWYDEFYPCVTRMGSDRTIMRPPAEILKNKRARSAVIGFTFGGSSWIVEEGRIQRKLVYGGYWNPHLYHAIFSVLHKVAIEAEKIGAIYWNTDGGVIPAQCLEHMQEVCARFGLLLTERARGNADIVSIGCYKVGDSETIPYSYGSKRYKSAKHLSKPHPATLADICNIIKVRST